MSVHKSIYIMLLISSLKITSSAAMDVANILPYDYAHASCVVSNTNLSVIEPIGVAAGLQKVVQDRCVVNTSSFVCSMVVGRDNEGVLSSLQRAGSLTHNRLKKKEQELRKKSAFKWGLFGCLTHFCAGLGIGYFVNAYKKGGIFLKHTIKPMVNSFLIKFLLPTGVLYFSRYASLQGGDMLRDIIGPSLNQINKKFSNGLKKVNGTLGRVDNLVEKNLSEVDFHVEKTLSLTSKAVKENIESAGSEVRKTVENIVNNSIPQVTTAMEAYTEIVGMKLNEFVDSNIPKVAKAVDTAADGVLWKILKFKVKFPSWNSLLWWSSNENGKKES